MWYAKAFKWAYRVEREGIELRWMGRARARLPREERMFKRPAFRVRRVRVEFGDDRP